MLERGLRLGFERRSVVRHFHADRLSRYLRVQRAQGYWRVALHLEHRGHGRGDSYSSLLDHLQPVVALLAPLALSCAAVAVAAEWTTEGRSGIAGAALPLSMVAAVLVLALLAMQLPMALAMLRREGVAMLPFVALGAVRALARGVGLLHGAVDRTLGRGAIAHRRLHGAELRP
jgi:hypothetical protein